MKEKIEQYLSTNNICKITDIMAEFLLGYKTVVDILAELYNERKIKQIGDNTIKYLTLNHEDTEEDNDKDEFVELNKDADLDKDDEECASEIDNEDYVNNADENDENIEDKKESAINDLLSRKYSYRSNKQFENLCMDVIEAIASVSPTFTRQDAISLAEELFIRAEHVVNKNALKIFERVKYEFRIASDKEYDLLRKQIFQ